MLKVEFDKRDVVKVNIDDIDEDNNELAAIYIYDSVIRVIERIKTDSYTAYAWVELDKIDRSHYNTIEYTTFKEALEGAEDYDVYIGDNLQDLLFEVFDKLVVREDD